jgi:hypothetical protein
MRRTAALLAVALLVTVLLTTGCAHSSDPQRHAAATVASSQWPVLGAQQPVLGVDLYALDNYPAAVVTADGYRTLSYIRNVLKANTVGIVWNFFAASDSSDSVQADSSTLSPANVAILTRIAAHFHLLVEYRPVILVPSEANNWSGKILPADPARWFSSYYNAELPYLTLAQSLDVREFVVATEMHYMNADPRWPSFFARVAKVYHGVVSYATWDYDYFPPLTHLMPLKYLGMDMYWHMQNLPADATQAQVVAAWGTLFTEMPPSVLQRTAIDETGIQARVGAYADPPMLDLPGQLDNQVQANWFMAACQTVHTYHMRGVFFWKVDLTDNPAFPASSMSTFEGRPSAQTISECAQILR